MTRTLFACLAAAAVSGTALADEPITIAPIEFGEDLVEKSDEYGAREFDRLARFLNRDLEQALHGIELADGTTLRVTILDARPNRPTFEQLGDRVGLSYQSLSVGGASVEGELIAADGEVIDRFDYSWNSASLRDVRGATTWFDARRTFSRFSRRVRDDIREDFATGS